jgi:vesicle coat complex subunit|tara:strand:- start:125 stop:586 length:462 start_codon:yes stop_codon:yes gene_type:complete
MAAGRGKRTEMTDISAALRTFASKGRPTKEEQAQRRQLFQKVIQYLTVGIDMSPVFSDVIMNAHTTDVATKKMLYHYITHYAQANADLALLTVNTLQKDCREEDPVIRGLALRSMASMRVPDLVEYLVRAEPGVEARTRRRSPSARVNPRRGI